ncbi:MAG: hypothetical protein AB7I59_14915 [Geminicoccaceae bacterium]
MLYRLLMIGALILGAALYAFPLNAGTDHGTDCSATRGSLSDGCDRGQLPTGLRCQVSCMGLAAAFLTLPVLQLPTPAIGWMPTGDVRGSGRELAPDLPPPKRSGIA